MIRFAAAAFAIAAAMIVVPPLHIDIETIHVVLGDTVDANGVRYRLVGFDAPETYRARCGSERKLGNAAKDRLRALIDDGAIVLTPVACSCPPGTQGTRDCNYGRSCARLTSHGEDVGSILIREGLARAYVCGLAHCPRRQGWC
jgi:endonuclease YncB( thermonuclease family)